ncbi:type ISP restriction/modification enzyme [Staphylococcus xylosus]|uniref:type ISP restriction/modification enzyme n=1 Tax=Staphylococcus xylosus TaxID=1288 RepID=UPI001CDBE943|nr:type ISP restriction/modification enzyme [Staphylococcus xylosus]MCA2503680.1 DEAD/DEAH box helicase [Staphylococcus xylosus]MCE7781325.1 DEAD/DEAH box helicase family protein [Staphylococcus xylosus]
MDQVEKKINAFDNLIDQINDTAGNIQRERGTLFEKLVLAYLKNEPTYKQLYSDVWLLNEVPKHFGIPKKDTGVDIVAKQKNGELVAIQAKFYKEKIGKAEINSFVADLGKHYYNRGLIISTVDEWNKNALDTVNYNQKNIEIIGLTDLRNSQIEWNDFDFQRPEKVKVKSSKKLRFYQKTALENAINHFKNYDRGQLIMAPGTGKTFTSLKIAEAFANDAREQYKVLYLVPSIQLLTQTLKGWYNDTNLSITSMAVTSDRDASRGDDGTEDIKATDIGYPATTSSNELLKNWNSLKKDNIKDELFVVYCTYHSIEVIADAQKQGFPDFDFIIADEAHRTTGAHESNKDKSFFTKVHDEEIIRGAKRLYQTATPKMYGEDAKRNAKEKSVIISSMDDEKKYGEVFYRMGFGQAVSYGILTDYKVMVLAIDEAAIQKDMQRALSDSENGLNIDDIGRIVGIWNGMMRRNGYKNPQKNSSFDGAPLERAIAFTRTIADSKKVSQQFEQVVNEYLGYQEEQNTIQLSMRHADGSMNALQKGNILDWLADDNKPKDEARIISNVRFLTEGIDVPSLDSVIFLAPKKSQVDIVQAVGRIMRKSEGKDYGYIILPVVIPTGETPETVLDNNKNYEVVWQIINALRSVDERFEAMIDKINIAKPKQLKVIGVGSAPKENNEQTTNNSSEQDTHVQTELNFEWDKFESAIYGKIVQKVGDRKYLENWSNDVAKIARRQIDWIKNKLKDNQSPIKNEFNKFVLSLKHNINEGIDDNQAAEMLSQHLITKPIFEALFDQYSFVNNNPVSLSIEKVIKELEKAGFSKEQENLQPLYESIRMRAEGIERAEDKQKVIISLYNKFFKTAFESTTNRLGIVFTPIEVVDFIIKSVDDVMKKHFSKSLADKDVHILDPFTGTGTFVVRTLSYLKDKLDSGEINISDITHKFMKELHANEIVLLSYYIAAINIEATFDDIDKKSTNYVPFKGIVLTDTFDSLENVNTLDDTYFSTNNERLKQQQKSPITVIIGNPPYSAKQKNEDGNQVKVKYPNLDKSLQRYWVEKSTATNKNNLFDSYIRALRWSANRIQRNGVIGFITNNSFIDGNAMDGMRKSLLKEFSDIYILNLKGAIRNKTKQQRSFEGENIFDIMTGVTIVLLIKDESQKGEGILHYLDIGNNMSKNEKLLRLENWSSYKNIEDKFKIIKPNEQGDWINQRNSNFNNLIPLGDKKNKDALFVEYSGGITTGRDDWSWSFSREKVKRTMQRSIDYYNKHLGDTSIYSDNVEEISWTSSLKRRFERNEFQSLDESRIYIGMYRPFTKKYVYYSKEWIDRQYQMTKIFPESNSDNLLISLSNKTNGKNFTSLLLDVLPDRNIFSGGSQNLPEYLYDDLGSYSAIREAILSKLSGLPQDDVMFYLYSVFHSKEYANIYYDDLSKSFPRLPNLKHKNDYIEIGRKLANLHLNYENQPKWEDVVVNINTKFPDYRVKKMKHPKKRDENGKLINDYSTIIFNDSITIENIPEKAYQYEVNGRSAIEWIINQYQVNIDRKSGVIDDPNEFSDNPKYILNLLVSIITVSMKTLKLIEKLPDFEIIE